MGTRPSGYLALQGDVPLRAACMFLERHIGQVCALPRKGEAHARGGLHERPVLDPAAAEVQLLTTRMSFECLSVLFETYVLSKTK